MLLYLAAAYFGSLLVILAMRWLDGEVAEFHRCERERVEELRRQREQRYGLGFPNWIRNGLALIRKAHAADIVDSLISVQPMTNRTGRIHYLDVMMRTRTGEQVVPTHLPLTPEQAAKRDMLAAELVKLSEQIRREHGIQTPPRAMTSWSLESEEQLKSLWGPDVSHELIRRALDAIQHEGDRAVRNAVIAHSAVEQAFAGWKLREQFGRQATQTGGQS